MHTGAVPHQNGVVEIDTLDDNTTFPSTEVPSTDSTHWREQKEMQPVWLCEVTRAPVTYGTCITCARN